mmetsp:Transcript_17805/g.58161  ORF Transcript_17805/g.58161 Transcript_17805/m.58161 type:complete len:293 (+) Transcript_17805:1177-2055(+)|eukprot:scaffold16396_cov115-Isochrysis_galbana.AAC.4
MSSMCLSVNSAGWCLSVWPMACLSWPGSNSRVDGSPATHSGIVDALNCGGGGAGGSGGPQVDLLAELAATSTGSPRPNMARIASDIGSPAGRGAMLPIPLSSSPQSSEDMTDARPVRCSSVAASPAATSTGVRPATLRTSRAPPPSSISHMSARPARAAACSAVSPSRSPLSIWTPEARSVTTSEPIPRAAAAARGSSPVDSATLGSARICSADLTPASLPAANAEEMATQALIDGAELFRWAAASSGAGSARAGFCSPASLSSLDNRLGRRRLTCCPSSSIFTWKRSLAAS